MELYNGRLDKTPGAIALRHRWYGTGTPELVFVERKTHRESWAGEVSVKERFIIPESKVPSLMAGAFDLHGEVKRLKDKGKSEDDIKEWYTLASEVVQAINSKQLVSTYVIYLLLSTFLIHSSCSFFIYFFLHISSFIYSKILLIISFLKPFFHSRFLQCAPNT